MIYLDAISEYDKERLYRTVGFCPHRSASHITMLSYSYSNIFVIDDVN